MLGMLNSYCFPLLNSYLPITIDKIVIFGALAKEFHSGLDGVGSPNMCPNSSLICSIQGEGDLHMAL
jgi:hypothetical protein